MLPGFTLTLAQADGPAEDAPPVTTTPVAPSNTAAPSTGTGLEAAPAGDGGTLSDGDPTLGGSDQPARQPGFLDGPMFPILMLGLLAYFAFSIWRSNSKEKKQRQEVMSALKKGDKIRTVGGILGTIVDIRKDEITLKVDESSNTRIRVAREAIRDVVDKDKAETKDKSDKADKPEKTDDA